MNYDLLYEFAKENRISYNSLCAMAEQAVPRWQHIKTAPKDGSSYLVWAEGVGMAHYMADYPSGYPHRGPVSENLKAWNVVATHWMPLPKGPK
jgi:hypothetical protein